MRIVNGIYDMNIFEISIQTINLFSIWIGMTIVVLSGYWGGRIYCTRLAFVYITLLALYYGFIKQNVYDFAKPSTTQFSHSQTYKQYYSK